MSGQEFKLNQIYFYLTNHCNLRCRHCWIAPVFHSDGEPPSLPFELFARIIKEGKAIGLKTVKLTGGEPLLHPRIMDILGLTKEEGLTLTIETNGLLCTPEIAKAIASCERPHVSVSLDGACAETHEWIRCVDGCFDDAITGIKNLVNAGLKPQVIMTLMRRNKDEVFDLVKLAASLGAGSVKINVLQPTERGERMFEMGESLTINEIIDMGKKVDAYSRESPIRVFYSHPPAFVPFSRMMGSERSCGFGVCGILGIIGVLADGSYALCGIGENVPELIFGHAARDSLEMVWANTKVLHELREGLPKKLKGVCQDCVLSSRCLGSCIAQNYYSKKDIWAPFWFCESARKAGLFPETRIFAIPKEVIEPEKNIIRIAKADTDQ